MSAQANIVAFDGAATPVSHTLVPVSSAVDLDGALAAVWGERLTTLPIEAQVRVVEKRRKLKSGVEQVSLTVTVPVMESISGQNSAGYTAAPKVAFEDTVVITGYFSARSAIANRRLARQLATNIFGGIATSVAPVTSGAAAELFDQSIIPS